jgi:hypothetical protein
MTEWLYKATPAMVSLEATRSLAVENQFICKAAHKEGGTLASNVQHVKYDDIIHAALHTILKLAARSFATAIFRKNVSSRSILRCSSRGVISSANANDKDL